MSSTFHAPYNFIPATGKVNGRESEKIPYRKIKDGEADYVRHDLWHKDAKHGRIICRVHLHTPTVAGGLHDARVEGHPQDVQPYCRDGKPAIPGNSLRGMIGSVAEMLSQSALRVLEDKVYSVRKPMDKGLSAVGILVASNEPSRDFDLLPLTIPISPHYPLEDEKWNRLFDLDNHSLTDYLPVHVAGYTHQTTKIRGKEKKLLFSRPKSFLACNPDSFQLEKRPEYYYALLGERDAKVLGGTVLGDVGVIHDDELLPHEKWKNHPDKTKYTKGILRVLGVLGRANDLPEKKHYELFIPWDEEKMEKPRPIAVHQHVIETFCTLADEQARLTEKNKPNQPKLPFTLQGEPDWKKGDKPEAGDLVFFDIQENNGAFEVSEISLSSIWRKAVDGTAHEFFKNIDKNNPDLVPWNRERKKLTPAEALFGVVEEEKRAKEKGDEAARNLAGRVRFSDARAIEDFTLMNRVTLKILSSPKPPSPAMYFHTRDTKERDYIAKTKLNAGEHAPNGRKVYLHHQSTQISARNWETAPQHTQEHLDQKMSCRPMPTGTDFYFHIDFDNLSDAELSLLLTSLRPDDNFRHRLGLGKSLGLGSVEVAIDGVFLIDRVKRYTEDALDGPRYHHVYSPAPGAEAKWKELYPQEAEAWDRAEALENLAQDEALIDHDTCALLKIVGDPDKLQAPVKPPLTKGQTDPEEKTFQWFVHNDDSKNKDKQTLGVLDENHRLPTLDPN